MADMNQRVHPDCVNAANPYHECAVNCLERIAQGHGRKEKKKTGSKFLEVSRSFGRKKKEPDSHPKPHYLVDKNFTEFDGKPHQLVNHPPPPVIKSPQKPQQVIAKSPVLTAVHPSKAPSPPPLVLSKTETDDGRYFSSSGGSAYSQDHSCDNEHDESTQTMVISKSGVLDQRKPPSVTNFNCNADEAHDEDEEDEKVHALKSDALQSFSFLGIPRSVDKKDSDDDDNGDDIDDSNDEDEVLSVISDSWVSVGKYQVKASVAKILQPIFDKHGDIAAGCELKSVSMRAYYLECLCSVVQELQLITLKELTKPKIKEMLAVVKDVESAKIEVGWLRIILNELIESLELSSRYQAIEAEKQNNEKDLEETRRELESLAKHLAEKEREVADAHAVIEETRTRLAEIEFERSRLHKMTDKVEKFSGKSILEELL